MVLIFGSILDWSLHVRPLAEPCILFSLHAGLWFEELMLISIPYFCYQAEKRCFSVILWGVFFLIKESSKILDRAMVIHRAETLRTYYRPYSHILVF